MNPMVQGKPTIEVGGQVFVYGPLPALAQFHVLRRCMPVLASFMGPLMAIMKEKDVDARVRLLMERVGPLSEVLAKMPDDDANYVIIECLKVCGSVHAGGVMPLCTLTGQITDSNLSMPAMLRLMMKVVDQHLADFFSLLGAATAAKTQPSTPTDLHPGAVSNP